MYQLEKRKTMPYSTYIFDLDGTLLDTLQDLANAVNHAMREMNYPERTLDEVRRFIGNGMKMLIRRAVPDGTGEKDCEKALTFFHEYYLAHIADFTKPYDGIPEVISALKTRGCRLAVVSNKSDDAANAVVEKYFGKSFDTVVGKRESFPAKPDPASVKYVIQTLGAEPQDTIYIGDSDVDVYTAHNAELKCIGVTWGNRTRQELIDSGADFIAESSDEILNI